jgi:signal transduction histidine kinase
MRGDFLVTAITHQADRLFRFYGINVEVIGTVDPNLSGKIAEATFQIVKEGLSNILRHTDAKNAFISIQSSDTHLKLEIGNDTENATPSIELFKPKSIIERVSSLNGVTAVETNDDGYSVVRVTIPIIKE